MHSNSSSQDLEENPSGTEPSSNDVVKSDSALVSSHHSTSSSVSVSEETYARRLDDRVRELKSDIPSQCRLDWLEKFDPSEHSPKVELNLLLTPTNRQPPPERMQGKLSRVT